MDAITMLKNDHREVEGLFKRFEKAGEKAYTLKRSLADRMIEELSKHAAIEEEVFYPVTRATVPGTDDIVLEAIEEHHIVKWVLSEIEKMDPRDERFDAKVTVLIENVRHHVKEEEHDYFPKVRDELGRKALADLGDVMEAAKLTAPTHPHPRAPQTPPANLVAGNVAGVIDRIGDTVSGFASGGVDAVQDVIGRIRGSKPQRHAPHGSRTARQARRTVRVRSDEAVERTVSSVRKARSAGKQALGRTAKPTRKAAAKATKKTATRPAAARRKSSPSRSATATKARPVRTRTR
jgi:hemerythrin superfamily protein